MPIDRGDEDARVVRAVRSRAEATLVGWVRATVDDGPAGPGARAREVVLLEDVVLLQVTAPVVEGAGAGPAAQVERSIVAVGMFPRKRHTQVPVRLGVRAFDELERGRLARGGDCGQQDAGWVDA